LPVAALDVYDQEPLPAGHPLLRLENAVLTPHLGYVTSENYRVFYGDAVENVRAFLAGNPIRVLEPCVIKQHRVDRLARARVRALTVRPA